MCTVVPEANTGRCPSLASGAGCIGINIGEEVTRIKPGPIDAIGMSIKRNYESGGPHLHDDRPADHARDIDAAVDGTAGDRAAVG